MGKQAQPEHSCVRSRHPSHTLQLSICGAWVCAAAAHHDEAKHKEEHCDAPSQCRVGKLDGVARHPSQPTHTPHSCCPCRGKLVITPWQEDSGYVPLANPGTSRKAKPEWRIIGVQEGLKQPAVGLVGGGAVLRESAGLQVWGA